MSPDGVAHPVSVSLPTGSRIVSLEVALDNVRVAMLLETSVGARLIVAAIARDASQGFIPVSIGAPVLDSLIDGDTAVDVAWIDRFSIATLTNADDSSFVSSFEVGAQRTSLGKPALGVSIVGGNKLKGLRVLGVDHQLQSPIGSSWQTLTSVDLLASQR